MLNGRRSKLIPICRIDAPHHQLVILSELQRVEESTQIGNCNASIWCEDPSAPFHSAQDDKTGEFAIKAICRIPYAERMSATDSGDAQWPYLIAGLPVTKLSAVTHRQIPICLTDSRTPGTNVPGVFTQKKFCTKAYSSGTVKIEPRLETITMLAPVSQF